ncbi:MAG TPA: hypothetical protein VG755_19005 [Nannocystaceae bacterium]|nr:hypothetical protein [Nannocystaceae bacterium]
MNARSIRSVAQVLTLASGLLAIPTPAQAGFAGIKELISVTQMQAANANSEVMEGATKQRQLLEEKKRLRGAQAQLEGASLQPAEDPQVSHAGLVVKDVEAIAAFESTASADGLDDAERKRLAELVSVARQRADDAAADAASAIADAKKQLAVASDSGDKAQLKSRVRSLRATWKAHRKTGASLRTITKKLA